MILTPNESHFSLAKEVLSAHKHVIIDKPMTVTSLQADELISLAKEKERLLSVFHNRRWDSDFLTLQALLSERRLGQVVELESRFDRFRPLPKGGWREQQGAGTGVLYDLGSHLLDQALVLFGLPNAVWADIRTQRPGVGADDWFVIMLDYPEQRVCLRASCLAAGPMARFTVRGTSGAWVKHGLDPQEQALSEGHLPNHEGWGTELESDWGVLYENSSSERVPSKPGAYPEFYRRIARALRGQGANPVEPVEARNVIYGLELCQKSVESGAWIAWELGI